MVDIMNTCGLQDVNMTNQNLSRNLPIAQELKQFRASDPFKLSL